MTTDDMDFEKSIKDTLANVDENTTVKAIVLDINEKEGVVFLDVNLKSEAQVPLTDFETKPSIGDAVDVYLIYRESHDGVPVVSLTKARQIKEKENIGERSVVEGAESIIEKTASETKQSDKLCVVVFFPKCNAAKS